MPGRVYFNSYGRFHAALSTQVLYPRAERAGLGERRRVLLREARGSTMEMVGAGIGINLPDYPPEVHELVLVLRHPHMRSRLRRAVAGSERDADLVESPHGPLPFPDDRFDTVVATLSLCLPPDLDPVLGEIARVLRPGGRLLFLEHVRSESPGLARWQDRLAGPWRYTAIGCNCNRDTLGAIAGSRLQLDRVEHGELRKLGPLIRPLVSGIAVLPSV